MDSHIKRNTKYHLETCSEDLILKRRGISRGKLGFDINILFQKRKEKGMAYKWYITHMWFSLALSFWDDLGAPAVTRKIHLDTWTVNNIRIELK